MPRVGEHDAKDDRGLERGDHHRGTGPLHEFPDGLDVAGNPRDVLAACLLVLGQHGQLVHLAERVDAEGREARLGRDHHARPHAPRDHSGHDQHDHADDRVLDDDRGVDAAGREEAEVGDALREERHGSLARGGNASEQKRDDKALAHFGADLKAALEGGPDGYGLGFGLIAHPMYPASSSACR